MRIKLSFKRGSFKQNNQKISMLRLMSTVFTAAEFEIGIKEMKDKKNNENRLRGLIVERIK